MSELSPDALSRRRFLTVAAASAAVAACAPAATRASAAGIAAPTSGRGAGGVVLFQGDSVTDSGRSRTPATASAANNASALGNGYPLLITAGLLHDQPATPWRVFNRGVSGNKVPDLEARWDADTLALKPDILSLLIGINDYWHTKTLGYKGTTAEFETQLGALLARTRKALPSVRLVVMEPFVLKVGAVDASWFPAFDERRAIVARVARAANATFVPLQEPFDRAAATSGPAHWAADGVHPTPAGHALIAERWRATVKL